MGIKWHSRSAAFAAFLFFVSLRCADAQLAWNTFVLSTNLPLSAVSFQSDFYFTNISAFAIRVTGAYSDCGCTIAQYPSSAIMPGKSGKIGVKIDVEDETGRLKRTVHIYTDSHNDSIYELTSIVEIPEIVVVSPLTLNFDRKNPIEQMVIFSNLFAAPIRIEGITYDSKNPVHSMVSEIERGQIFGLHIKPSPAKEQYIIQFDVSVQQRESGVTKHYRFQANVN
jgi:hypothetical protein